MVTELGPGAMSTQDKEDVVLCPDLYELTVHTTLTEAGELQ